MKLLIFTQKVDLDDTYLGFFHEWIAKLATHCESVIVVGLSIGQYDLPANVKVYSLGKESGASRLTYMVRFFKYSWRFRRDYDAVFIHQNQEYAILGGILWKCLRKRVYMWRNHYVGSILTDIAAAFCTNVFCTSKDSYTAKFKKTIFMPVGVDIEPTRVGQSIVRAPKSILYLGRIARSKRIEVLIDACAILKKEGTRFTLSVYGNASDKEQDYPVELEKKVEELDLSDRVSFYAGIPHAETAAVYAAHEAFVNLSPSGMYDKTIFEAIAGGCMILVANEDIRKDIDDRFFGDGQSPEVIAAKLRSLLALDDSERFKIVRALKDKVLEKNSLSLLAQKLVALMST